MIWWYLFSFVRILLLRIRVVLIATVRFWDVFRRDLLLICTFIDTRVILFGRFLFFYHFCRLNFLNAFFWVFLFCLKTFILLNNLITLFTELSLIFESVSISESVQTMIWRRTARRNTSDHDDFGDVVLIYKGISKNKS